MSYKNLKKVLKNRRLHREKKNLFQGESLEPRHAFDGSDALDAALVISPNQAPVNNLPAEQTTFGNQPLAFTPYKGNAISISDVDAGLSHVQVTIEVTDGTLLSANSDPRGGVTYHEGDGVDDTKMVVQGTVSDLNELLQWVVYKPAKDFAGEATLTVETDDLGNGSYQRAKIDRDTLQISVDPLPDYKPSPAYETLPGVFDETFFGDGTHQVSILGRGTRNYIKDSEIMPDGSLVAVGSLDGRATIMRFNPDMSLDVSFGESGGYTIGYGASEYKSLSLDNQGRFLAIGAGFLARFESNGKRDLSFSGDNITLGVTNFWDSSVDRVAIRDDGSIVVAGNNYSHLVSDSGKPILRAHRDNRFVAGRVAGIVPRADSTITFIGVQNGHVEIVDVEQDLTTILSKSKHDLSDAYSEKAYHFAVRKDGGVLLAGMTNNDLSVAAFNRDGSLDNAFGVDGVAVVPILSAKDYGYRLTVAEDGKVLVAGIANNGQNNDFVIVRLNKDGSVDESFGNRGKVVTNWGGDDQAYIVEVLPNGKILAAGKAGNSIGFVQLLGDSRVGVPVSTVYLSETSTVENGAPGSVIGSLTTDSATDNSDTTYALVSGAGDIDNDAFTIVGSELQSAASFDYETKSSYTVRVRATTVDGHVVEQAFSILIENANDLPTGSVEISGVPTAGETLVAENSIFDQDGVGTLEYQWSRDGVAIEGATAETYTLSAADVGAVIAVRVNYTDAQGTAETVTSEGTSPVASANQAPFGLNLSAAFIAENKITGSIVGELSASDPDADDVLTYSLVSGEGDTGNDSFEIVGSELRAAASFDFELQNQYSIRVRATDSAGLLTEKTFSIGISNVNEAPFDLTVSAETINENEIAGSVVGKLTAADPDAEDVLTYSLVAGEDAPDNDLFEIVGDELRTKMQFDFESKSSYTVRVRATDSEGSLTEQTFVISIKNVNEVPFDLRLSSHSVLENAAVGTVVGELNASDPDADDVLTYSLVSGEGGTDNALFEIVGAELRTKESFNFETQSAYSVRIGVTDSAGLVTSKTFRISVNDVNERPLLDVSAQPKLESIVEDSGVPVGEVGALVSALIDTDGTHQNFWDEDGDSPGIAITGVNLEGGTLWYSTDNGLTWSTVDSVSEETPRVFVADAKTRLYYQPAADFTGMISDVISFEAWDGAPPVWSQLGLDIDGEAAGDDSGWSVSLSADGQTVAIGARQYGLADYRAGYVRIFSWDGSAWNQLGSDIDGEAAGDNSGWSVSLSADGQTVAIGAPFNDGNDSGSGHVRIFSWDGSAWNQLGSDIDGEAAGDDSGWSVSLSADGQTVAIGAPHATGTEYYPGHVRIYSWDGSAWNQLGSDIDGEAAFDSSGWSVSLSADGQTVAIGAPTNDGNDSVSGHVRIFSWDGSAWNQLGSDIDGEAAGDNSGWSVSLSADGQTVAIGALSNDGNDSGSGHVRIFSWDGSAWNQLGSDIDGEAAADASGRVFLSADGQTVAIGASRNDGNDSGSGHVRIFSWDGSAWNQLASDIDGEAAADASGRSVSLSADGQTVAIGAPFNDGNDSRSGHVRIYQLVPAAVSTSTAVDTISVEVTNINDSPTGGVFITGTAVEGQALFATNDLTDSDGLGAISYQWKRNGAEIEGAVADAYMLTQSDVGAVITVTASYTDEQGTEEAVDSQPTSLVIAANKAPSELGLSSTQIQENKVPGTIVGELSAVDPDADDVLTYSLVVGEGDVDNNSFEIIGAELRATETFDYETKSSYSVRIRVTDSGGMSSEKAFDIEVTDVDETVATGTTFDYLILEAQQAGSTVDIDDIRVIDLGSNAEFYSYDFETDDLTGIELFHSEDSGYEYSENPEMTRIQDGRLRLETTGFLQNGAGGYNSRSRMVIPTQLPDEFEITFTARKLQWAGHFKVILGNSESDYADISTQNGNEFGVHDGDYGFYVLQAGGAVPTHAGVLINLEGEAVEVPTQNSLRNLYNTDARYRIVRQANQLSLYVNDVLIATKTDLVDPSSPIEDAVDVDVPLVIAAEEGVISLDAEITYDPNVVQLHDIAADANLPEGTIAMLTEIAPGRSYLGIMTTPALGDASYVLGSLSATITGSSETLASLVTFENVQLNEGAVAAYDADGNLVIRLGNSAPTGISLSGTEVAENSPLYTAIGSFETTDIDTTDQFTYQLVPGEGAANNSDFVIDGNVLRTLSPLDYETQSSYSLRVRSTDTIGQFVEQVFTITVGDVIESLIVTGLTSNQSGFTVSFNEAVSEDQLNLYDGFGVYGEADITVTGTTKGEVTGSAVLSNDGMSLVFVSSTPLANDTYTVVLNSGEKAFVGVDGRLLDGNSDGTAGDNYTDSFVISDASSTVVSTPSFARAPGESVDLGTGAQRGLPVQLDSDGSVQSVAFTVEYDPAVIRVDSIEKGVTLPAGATMTHSIVTPGNIAVTITSSQAISAGSATLAVMNASIADDADYAASSVVTIKDVVVNGGQAVATGSSAVHVAAKLGDTSGDGTYSAFDAVLAARVAAFKDTGLAAYPMVDPVVVADVSGNGDIKMYDSGLVASVPSDGSTVGPSNSASGNTTNVIFRENGQFGSASVSPMSDVTNERAKAFLEYAKAAKMQNFANTASAAASGSVGASQSGGGESMAKRSKLLFAPLPVAK